VPSEEGLGPDNETTSASLAQEPAQARQHSPVRWAQGGASDLTAQHGDLMAEHDNLDGQVLLRAARVAGGRYRVSTADKRESSWYTPRRQNTNLDGGLMTNSTIFG
jgi:hypothetical protein